MTTEVAPAPDALTPDESSALGASRLEARIMIVVVLAPLIGIVAATALLWGGAVVWYDLAILAVIYVPVGLGITIGYHRMLTHRSFDAPPFVRAFFLACGSMALQGGAISWAVDHRQHHAFSDREGDPHSPHHGYSSGIKSILAGLWHAHAGWMFDPNRKRNVARYGKDLLADPVARFFQRTFLLWAIMGFVLPAFIGLAIGGWRGFAAGLLWGGLVRVFLNHHVTWSVNSICHYFGRRPYRTTDLSTNNWVLAIPSFGESWHHNHHVFPSSAVHGVDRGQIDLSALIIGGLERVRLVSNVRRPTSEQRERKRAAE